MNTTSHIGEGIYTIPDMARIFNLPTYKVGRWIKDYWDSRLMNDFQNTYSWTDGKSRAVNFHTLIELYIYIQLMDAGVNTRHILKAHQELQQDYRTKYPFAKSVVIMGLRADGKKVSFETQNGEVFPLDGSKQFKFEFYKDFLKKLDFGEDELVSRFWPNGKDSSIVLDPNHHFGQPVIHGTNIVADSIYSMYSAGDSIPFISSLYEITEKDVKDAIQFCEAA